MAQRAEEAKERPVHMSQEQWEWYKKTRRMYPSIDTDGARQQSRTTFRKTEDHYTKKQRAKFKEMLLTHPIKGDQYIDGPPSKWREFILKWINTHQEEENFVVSLEELLKDMKAGGITFNQSDTHVKHPVKDFLVFYQVGLK